MTATALTGDQRKVMVRRICDDKFPLFQDEMIRLALEKTEAINNAIPVNALANIINANNPMPERPKSTPLVNQEYMDSTREYYASLKVVSDQDLLDLYNPLKAADDNAGIARIEAEDNKRWLVSDIQKWGRKDRWTIAEAVALSFRRDPDVLTLAQAMEHKSKSLDAYGFMSMYSVARTAVDAELLSDDGELSPVEFLDWARGKNYTPDAELEAFVYQLEDRPTYIRLEDNIINKDYEIEFLKDEIEQLKLAVEGKDTVRPDMPANTQPKTAREKKTVDRLKLLELHINEEIRRNPSFAQESPHSIAKTLSKRDGAPYSKSSLDKILAGNSKAANRAFENGWVNDFTKILSG